MNTARSTPSLPRNLLTVDLGGLKPLLAARAAARRVPVSNLVKEALQAALQGAFEICSADGVRAPSSQGRTRISLRLASEEALQLVEEARRAGLPMGAYVLTLVRHADTVASKEDRAALIRALVRSNAELASFARRLARLTDLLERAEVQAARPYTALLDRVGVIVREHLAHSSRALAASSAPRVARSRRRHG